MIRYRVDDSLAKEACARLGVALPSTWDDVGVLYRRWCAEIPFDTIAKTIALIEDTPLPGADAKEVFERWLATGVGSNCWGHCVAFAAVLGAVGIESRIALDRGIGKADGVIDFHSFVIASDGEIEWSFDHIHATASPVKFVTGASGAHGAYRSGFRTDGDRLVHWYDNPERPDDDERYAVLATDLDVDDVQAFCEISRHYSGVRVGRLYARRFTFGAATGGITHGFPLDDGSLFEVRDWDGAMRTDRRFEQPDEVLHALGYPPEALASLERARMFSLDSSGGVRWSIGPAV